MVNILYQIKPNLIPDLVEDLGRFKYLAEVLSTVSRWGIEPVMLAELQQRTNLLHFVAQLPIFFIFWF